MRMPRFVGRQLPWGLVLAACVAGTASAQDAAQRIAIPERLAPATRAAIGQLMDSLDSEALPSRALRDKAAEGVLKGADDARVLTAVRALAQRLRRASQALGHEADDDALLAASGALYVGVSPDGITRVAAAHRRNGDRGSLSVPLTVLSELVLAQVPVDVAIASLDTLLARGAADDDLRAFRSGLERDIRGGRAPRVAAEAGVRQVLQGVGRQKPQ